MKCSFCSLYTSAGYNERAAAEYIEHLQREIEIFVKWFPHIRSPNIYFGGGTPALISEAHLQAILDSLRPVLADITESRSVEFSPDIVTKERGHLWRRFGFDRASLGVQSFNNARLATMHRHHDGLRAKQAIDELTDAGFRLVNVDLIFGGYCQTEDIWLDDLKSVLNSSADSCTFHPLALVPKTAFERKLDEREVAGNNIRGLHEVAIDAFTKAGWFRTSAISFSRTGTPNPLEHAEARGVDTFGLGAGSRSYIGNVHLSTLPAERRVPFGAVLKSYYDAVDRGEKPTMSAVLLDDEEVIRRSVILALHHGTVDWRCIEELLKYETSEAARELLTADLEPSGDEHLGTSLRLRDDSLPDVASMGLKLSSRSVRSAVATALGSHSL